MTAALPPARQFETDRLAWLERQFRLLLIELATGRRGDGLPICVNSTCEEGPIPHMASDGYEHPVRFIKKREKES